MYYIRIVLDPDHHVSFHKSSDCVWVKAMAMENLEKCDIFIFSINITELVML